MRREFTYDFRGRRVHEVTTRELYGFEGGLIQSRSWVYDDWNPVLEYRNHRPVQALLWGIDLSGSAQGAGGVGGLIAIEPLQASGIDSGKSAWLYGYDANGNVTHLYDDGGVEIASYEYDAFGRLLWHEGPAAEKNCWGFSTKMQDEATGMLYYGFRYYMPDTGKWASRDPIAERGGVNLYGFVKNQPTNGIDVLGNVPHIGVYGSGYRNPPGPNIGDQFGDGPLGNESEYWDDRFPGWVAEAKRGSAEKANTSVTAECGDLREGQSVQVGYSKTMTPSSDDSRGPLRDLASHLFGRNYGGNGNDDDFGDRAQDGFEANYLYGTVTFKLESVEITDGPSDDGRCCYDWRGDLTLVDDLGTSADDHRDSPGWSNFYNKIGVRGGPGGGERMTRSTWEVTGRICCD